MSKYLRREADSFVFRRRVPAALQRRVGLKEIYRSLKTTVRRTAKARAAHLFIVTERLFRMVEEQEEDILSDEDIQAAVRYWLSSSISWQIRLRNNLEGLSPGMLREHHQKLPDMLLDMGRAETASSEQNIIEEAWSALEFSDYTGMARGENLKRTIAVLRSTLKEYVDKRVQEVFLPETVAPVAAGDPARQTPPSSTNLSKLSSFIEDWQIDLRKGYDGAKGKKSTTADPYRKDVELFIGLMGDLPVGKITYEVAADFRKKLLALPSNHGKSRTGSLKQELALARANKTAPRMTMKTVKRHFSGLNSIWRWLVYKRHIPAKIDPFLGHSFPGTKSKKSARDTWSTEDMQRLFSSSEYRQADRNSAMHWLPLISLYSGMRLEEICRLRPHHDLAVRDGIYCFIIQEREGWDPKTEAGARVIPVHSWLMSHGFAAFVQEMKARDAEHLFPELELKRTKLSAGFSRDFSRTKIALSVGRKTAFHSFRHTFRTELESTSHRESHIDAVMGHEGGQSEGRVYTKGVTTAKLQEVVESFSPALDIATLLREPAPQPTPGLRKRTTKPKIAKRVLTPPVFDETGKLIRSRRR